MLFNQLIIPSRNVMCILFVSVCQLSFIFHLVFVGSKINGFSVTIAQNGAGCLLLLLLLPNGRALTIHGTQKGNSVIVFSANMLGAV
jgi:hypothetical protein